MTKEFYALSKGIANLPEDVAKAAVEASDFPQGNPGDALRLKESKSKEFETKTALFERYFDWQKQKEQKTASFEKDC